MHVHARAGQRIIIIDGAMGTVIQQYKLQASGIYCSYNAHLLIFNSSLMPLACFSHIRTNLLRGFNPGLTCHARQCFLHKHCFWPCLNRRLTSAVPPSSLETITGTMISEFLNRYAQQACECARVKTRAMNKHETLQSIVS